MVIIRRRQNNQKSYSPTTSALLHRQSINLYRTHGLLGLVTGDPFFSPSTSIKLSLRRPKKKKKECKTTRPKSAFHSKQNKTSIPCSRPSFSILPSCSLAPGQVRHASSVEGPLPCSDLYCDCPSFLILGSVLLCTTFVQDMFRRK